MAKQYIMRLTADRCIYYKAFPHEEARKILDKFDIHYTPTGMKKAMPSLALWTGDLQLKGSNKIGKVLPKL